MKALILKELRENLKLAVLGLVIFSALLALDIHNSRLLMKSLAGGSDPEQVDIMQPLISHGSLMLIGYFLRHLWRHSRLVSDPQRTAARPLGVSGASPGHAHADFSRQNPRRADALPSGCGPAAGWFISSGC